jgi:hypothetical protein
MTASVTALQLGTARPSLLRVDETTDENGATVTVTLGWDDRPHVGTAGGSPATEHRALLVAAAALAAVASVRDNGYRVRSTEVATIGDDQVAVVIVEGEPGDKPLVGAAVIEEDNRQVAFARAALDAVNRRVFRPR